VVTDQQHCHPSVTERYIGLRAISCLEKAHCVGGGKGAASRPLAMRRTRVRWRLGAVCGEKGPVLAVFGHQSQGPGKKKIWGVGKLCRLTVLSSGWQDPEFTACSRGENRSSGWEERNRLPALEAAPSARRERVWSCPLGGPGGTQRDVHSRPGSDRLVQEKNQIRKVQTPRKADAQDRETD